MDACVTLIKKFVNPISKHLETINEDYNAWKGKSEDNIK